MTIKGFLSTFHNAVGKPVETRPLKSTVVNRQRFSGLPHDTVCFGHANPPSPQMDMPTLAAMALDGGPYSPDIDWAACLSNMPLETRLDKIKADTACMDFKRGFIEDPSLKPDTLLEALWQRAAIDHIEPLQTALVNYAKTQMEQHPPVLTPFTQDHRPLEQINGAERSWQILQVMGAVDFGPNRQPPQPWTNFVTNPTGLTVLDELWDGTSAINAAVISGLRKQKNTRHWPESLINKLLHLDTNARRQYLENRNNFLLDLFSNTDLTQLHPRLETLIDPLNQGLTNRARLTDEYRRLLKGVASNPTFYKNPRILEFIYNSLNVPQNAEAIIEGLNFLPPDEDQAVVSELRNRCFGAGSSLRGDETLEWDFND